MSYTWATGVAFREAMMNPARFSNDTRFFESAFIQYYGSGRKRVWEWLAQKRRGIESRWGKLRTVFWWGREAAALRDAEKFVQNGWLYVAPNDVWRFDTGGGKRILGIAGEMAIESHVVVLSVGEKGNKEVAFKKTRCGVGVLRAETGNWGLVEGMMEGAKGWIFVNPLQYTEWRTRRQGRGDKQVVYDAHDIFVEAYKRWGIRKDKLMAAERRLLEDAETVWFCTEADRATTRRRYADLDGRGWKIVPNGIDRTEMGKAVVPSETRKRRTALGWTRPVVLFAGANYGPNYEAVDEISRNWAPRHPEVTFVVLGMRMDRYLRDGGVQPASNVVFTGLVSEGEKRALYDLADVAIVPLKTGTGSSLKVPEAIARGKIVIGTRVGLRGFNEWTAWESILETERGEEELFTVLSRLEQKPEAYDRSCQRAAEELQRQYCWATLMSKWRGQWDKDDRTPR